MALCSIIWACLGTGGASGECDPEIPNTKNGLLWLLFGKEIPRLVSAAIVMEEACIFRM